MPRAWCCPVVSTSRSSSPTPTLCAAWPGPRRRADAGRDRRLARDLPGDRPALHLHRGYPGETEAEFETLLEWLDEAQLDRVGCFQYEDVKGRAVQRAARPCGARGQAGALGALHGERAGHLEAKLAAKVGTPMEVLVDEVDEDGATCRTKGDAPEIDGNLFIDEDSRGLRPGDLVTVEVEEAGEYDLWGRRLP
jgi:ribosomal protein S12 methylthiotransferase